MPDFARWILAVVSSVVIAGIVFVLATVGLVVAFFVFLVLFVVIGFTMRRQSKQGVRFGSNGTQFVFYTNIPGAPSGTGGTGETDHTTGVGRTPDRSGTRRLVESDGLGRPDRTGPAAQGFSAGNADDAGQTYDLSPDEYTVESPAGTAGAASEKKEPSK